MKRRFLPLACLAVASWAAAACAQNTLTDSERVAGWELLFDGKSLDQWRNYQKDTVSDGWTIKDGALTRSESGAGDIITKKKYGAFVLSLEFKISKGGNSGVMFHVTEEEKRPWQTGPEIQIQDNVDGHDPQKAGWLYQLYSAEEDACRPAGEWNQLRVKITPEQCEIQMNGVRYFRFKKGSPEWDRRVAKSKFAQYENFGKADRGHICLQDHGDLVSFRNIKIRDLDKDQDGPQRPSLDVKAVRAFTKVKWTGWQPFTDDGVAQPLRPIAVTHMGDGSDRIAVPTQRGVIHVIQNKEGPQESSILLDMESKVVYQDRRNEEGLLGLAFHPKFKENGHFFVYYTSTEEPQLSVISRFTAMDGARSKAALDSEVEIMRIKQPFWNHNGGTLAFGPDGMLYIALGDGGAANDPLGNGQNLGTLLGSILRIDVDRQEDGKNYAIPADNPFVNKEGARGEIYAYGFRNVWRLSFDRETGQLWAGDVGQNLWEEIDIVKKGGNYGWNRREGMHPFGADGVDANDRMIDPIFEYDHVTGKSITGGVVYRGEKVPALQGAYVYADYVSGKIWALKYKDGKVVSNHYIPSDTMPVITFGEDEQGEVYFAIVDPKGKGIYRFEEAK